MGRKKGGIITTLYVLILFIAGAGMIALGYTLDMFRAPLKDIAERIYSFLVENIAFAGSNEKGNPLLVPGVFLIVESLLVTYYRRRKPYSLIFSFYLYFVYFSALILFHLRSGIMTPAFVMERVGVDKIPLVSILCFLEVVLGLVIMYITGSLDQKWRTSRARLEDDEAIDYEGSSEEEKVAYPSRHKLKKAERRAQAKEAKRQAKEEKKLQKEEEKRKAEEEKQERLDRIAFEREQARLEKKEAKKKAKAERKAKKEDDQDIDETFNTSDLEVKMDIPEPARSMDEPLSVPTVGEVPRFDSFENADDIDLVSPDPMDVFKKSLGLDDGFAVKDTGSVGQTGGVDFSDSRPSFFDDGFSSVGQETSMPKYSMGQAGGHFTKGGILEATLESLNDYQDAPIRRPSSPIIGLDNGADQANGARNVHNGDNFAPSNLSKNHPRYKLFESLRNQNNGNSSNVSHIPSMPFVGQKSPVQPNSYDSTFVTLEQQKSSLSDRLERMKRESFESSNPYMTTPQTPVPTYDMKKVEEERIETPKQEKRIAGRKDVFTREEEEEKPDYIEELNRRFASQIKDEQEEIVPPPRQPAVSRSVMKEEEQDELPLKPMRSEDIPSMDEKHKGKYDDGSDTPTKQENEMYYSVGIGGLASNDEGMSGIRARARMRYNPPSADMLVDYPSADRQIDAQTIERGERILTTLHDFKVDVTMSNIVKGPTVTMYELKLADGVPVSKIKTRYDDLQYALGERSIRILAPVPGKQAVGIEVPNRKRATIGFKDMLETFMGNAEYKKFAVPMILGRTITGEPVSINVAKAPHLLIAGSTGSGKSVGINSLIATILYTKSPRDVRLIMVDPKVVELKIYNGIPHLLTPVITEAQRVKKVLAWLTEEMDRRYEMISRYNVRNIEAFNEKLKKDKIPAEKLPYIVLIMDEYADLMSTIGKDIEFYIGRLAAMARAVGIHLVLATQRPSAEVVTGTIKNNIPTRIAFAVSSSVNSKIILDEMGAESLLGKGDMLYKTPTSLEVIRIQGAFLSDGEVEQIVEQVKLNGEADYLDESIFEENGPDDDLDGDDDFDYMDSEEEEYERAKQIVYEKKSASASYLQRRMKIGYNKAARYVERMEEDGIVGPPNGSKPRELLKMV